MGAVDSGIFICGGFSKLKASKDADKGQIHSDAFMLTFDSAKKAWKWEKGKFAFTLVLIMVCSEARRREARSAVRDSNDSSQRSSRRRFWRCR
jgi:hypothetical protein